MDTEKATELVDEARSIAVFLGNDKRISHYNSLWYLFRLLAETVKLSAKTYNKGRKVEKLQKK